MFREDERSRGVAFVHDATLAKGVLKSPNYRQFNFLARILEVADPEKTYWIRRFCDVGLIMGDGPEHLRRRTAMASALERCVQRLQAIEPQQLAASLPLENASPLPAHEVAAGVVAAIFAESIAAISGHEPAFLEPDDLATIDFFNPFPTLSTLARCNAAIDRCGRRLRLPEMSADAQAAVLSLLIMGVSPMQGILTVAINACVEALAAGRSVDEALAVLKEIDAYSVVPTNFVMRECEREDGIGDVMIRPGDVVYLFLATASGCPFSRQNSVPFGAGPHYCSGAKLTSVMLSVARKALAVLADRLGSVEPSRVVQGKAHAFLVFRGSVA
jgi:cytochrome P450